MMDIGKYFSSSKKRGLSDNSKEAADPKKAKEATSSSSYSDHDVFEEDLDSSNCRSILFDCLKNLESKVNEIFANTYTLKENQINPFMHVWLFYNIMHERVKGEKQLADSLKQLIFFRKSFMNLKSIGSSMKI